jgi:integrase
MKNIDPVSLLKVFNNNGYDYIYIYYKTEGQAIRINTKCRWIKNKMTVENLYNSRMENGDILNQQIEILKRKVDSYILDELVSGASIINQKGCQKYIKNYEKILSQKMFPDKIRKDETLIIDYYKKFHEEKKTSPFIKPISLKNYKTLQNFLTDFELFNQKKLKIDDVDESFINKMITFSQSSLSKKDGYITKGMLQQNTLKKRLDVFKEFLIWLSDKEIRNFTIHKLFPKIERTNKEVVYVTIEELKQLILKRDRIDGDYNKQVIDSFIFNCEVGLRYQDLSNLTQYDFIQIPEGYILKKELNKHSIKYSSMSQIPIVNLLLIEIIEKYKFHFVLKSNQEYNRTLHRLFKKHELMTEPITVKRKYIKGKVAIKEVLKNDVITCHSCRRSMITNSFLAGYTDAQVMQMSGHKDLKMLQKYSNFANDELLNQNLKKKLSENKK